MADSIPFLYEPIAIFFYPLMFEARLCLDRMMLLQSGKNSVPTTQTVTHKKANLICALLLLYSLFPVMCNYC